MSDPKENRASDLPRTPPHLHDLELPGCTPEPLMAYLKALGILRLVSEQADPAARGWWRNDTLWMRCPGLFQGAGDDDVKRGRLAKFFLERYKPTPIVAPWAGGSGFFKKDNKSAVEAIGAGSADRVESYRQVIQEVKRILSEDGIHEKPEGDEKTHLIQRYRRELPDELVSWIDAAMVTNAGRPSYAPLLGTGGNDGRLDFTQNFMQRVVSLNLHAVTPPGEESRQWLCASLFSSPARLSSASVGQFSPGRAGGPNATQGMEGASTDNPWDFVLMLEGSLVLAGAASKRLSTTDSGRAAFPFTVRAVAAGFDSPASKDEDDSRGELWLPLWAKPATLGELRHFVGEGRADVSGRAARDGADFARSVATLGVDRGITAFTRLGFLKRSGKAYLAAPLGRFEVRERREADLLREIDPWLDRLRSACSADAPSRFTCALRGIDSAIFDFCRYGGSTQFQEILIAIGRAERELALTPGKVGRSKSPPGPLADLSSDWITAAAVVGSAECGIARALAGVDDPQHKVGSLRTNLEPVTVWWDNNKRKQKAKWAEKGRADVWNAGDLPTNLVAVLARRTMDGDREGCHNLPLGSPAAARLSDIARFIAGDLDEGKIEHLLWGMMLVDPRKHVPSELPDAGDIPRAFALLKLLFLPRPLVIERRAGGRVRARLAALGETGIRIRPEPHVLHLLRAGCLGEGCEIAMRRLRASGLAPMPRARAGRTRDHVWKELDRMGSAGIDPIRLAAALLIPIADAAVARLVALVTRPEDIETEPEPAGSPTVGD